MDGKEKKFREEIGAFADQMDEIVNKAMEENRDLSKKESKEWEDLNTKATSLRDTLDKHLASQKHRDDLNDKADPLNDDGTKKDVKVKGNKAESKEALYENTAKIFKAILSPKLSLSDREKDINESLESLLEGGHYKGFQVKNAAEAFSTLTDPDGGIFLPTTISDQIMEIERDYGAFPANSMRFPMVVGGGRQILPNLLGEITFWAVNQGSEANASRFTFSGLALEELKWMAFIPWTNEVEGAAGPRLVELIMRKLGEASAGIKDDAAMNADGTSTYHNLKGLVARSDDAAFAEVRKSTAATGNNTLDEIDEDDFINATLDVAPSIRARGIYVLHPDWAVRLRKIKDTEGRPLYLSGGAISLVEGNWTIFGHRVAFSEKTPNTDGASEDYGMFYVPDYFAFGDVGAFSAEQLTEATIKDVNGNDIRLASQDMKALRVKEFFDFELSQLTISSGGASLGAFTVLETAAT